MTLTLRSTCYNHQDYVLECLDSVAEQDSGGFEWVIVDDASTDNSPDLIQQWLAQHHEALRARDIRVELILHEQNRGFTATLNEILTRAKGDWLCGISCDDRMLPHRLSRVRQAMQAIPQHYAGIYGDAYVIDAHGQRSEPRFIARHRALETMPQEDLFEVLLAGNFIPAPTVAVVRQRLLDLGGYDVSLAYEDYDMWLRLTRTTPLAYDPEPTVEYRIHGQNLHLQITDWRQINYWIYRKHLDVAAGARRFFGNLKGLQKHGQINACIREDVRQLDLAGQPGGAALQRAILAGHC